MATVALATEAVSVDHGTAGHWTAVQPLTNLIDPPVLRATHDFVLARDGAGNCLAAIYHGGIPAWAIENGRLIGCLLRNTPTDDGLGAAGHDDDAHTQDYAIRVPGGLGDPAAGQPLREALAFSVPLSATAIPAGSAGPQQGSLASLPPESPAILTVSKPGTYDPGKLILRLQQPTNGLLPVEIGLGLATPAAARLITAVEGQWTGGGSATVTAQNTVLVQMAGALATVEIGIAGSPPAGEATAGEAEPPPTGPRAAPRGLIARLLAWLLGLFRS
jgi:alpha-mannosidase